MKHTRFRGFALALACASLPSGAALAAGAQPRAWVSGLGANVATCGAIAAPCRTLQYAHDNVVAPGGSIYVKGPANYGQIVIRQSISIINDGSGTATILAPVGNAVEVRTTATDRVLIKGMTIDGSGRGVYGIYLPSAGSLTVEDCTIQSLDKGVNIAPNAGDAAFLIDRTRIVDNRSHGVLVDFTLPGRAVGSIRASVIVGGQHGIEVFFGAALVADTVIDGASVGLLAANGSSLLAKDVRISGSTIGAEVENGAVLSLSGGRFTANGTDLVNGASIPAILITYGDNAFATLSGSVAPMAKQ